MTDNSNRRQFIQAGTAASALVAAGFAATSSANAAESNRSANGALHIGLVGAGGRGGGAINDSLTANENVKLVAIADLSKEKGERLVSHLEEQHGKKVEVEPSKIHTGLDARHAIHNDPNVDLVIHATPPGFRPSYISEAIEAGKHVFAEKPACVDPAGYHVCLKAHDAAIAKDLAIVTGTQYRRQTDYIDVAKRIAAGEIGEVLAATARYCSSGTWYRGRKEGMSDTEYQLQNWMHFIWLSGDQIVEQAVHNIDAVNWLMGANPLTAFGSGGRFTRPDDSELWDNMSIDYEYPDGRMVSFMCRQIPGAQGENSNVIYGSDGVAHINGWSGSKITDRAGKKRWSMKGDISAAYRQEHKDLVDSIRAQKPIVELRQTAESSLVAVMGRLAAYSGQKVDWEFMTKESKLDLFPKGLNMSGDRPEPSYAIPGLTSLE